jgi:CheY-like chemotaxis protein
LRNKRAAENAKAASSQALPHRLGPRQAGVLPFEISPCAIVLGMQARIYHVEDNPLILQWLAQALEDLAQARVVGSAATQADACQWLNGHRDGWDAAVVDLWLAQGNGIHVIECLHTSPAQKIVVLTNYPTQPMREIYLSAGAHAFF